MNYRFHLSAVMVSLLSLPLSGLAGIITVPTGLNPGDQYRLVFVTSQITNAESTDINYYNNFVTADANSVPTLAALNTTWTAIASTPTVDARDNTLTNSNVASDTSVPIYNLENNLVATSNLWISPFGTHVNPIEYNEQGNPTDSPYV